MRISLKNKSVETEDKEKRYGSRRQPGASRSRTSARAIDRGEAIYDRLINAYGCDPFEVMARIAMADVVGLGLMTEEEIEAPAEVFEIGRRRIRIPSGREKMVELIPPGARLAAAKELAQYCKPKLAATQFLGKNGEAIEPSVVFYTPNNNRDGRANEAGPEA